MNRPPPVEGAEEGEGSLDAMGRPIPTEELFVKDAFLVFRALCKLSMKALVTETYVLPPMYEGRADEQRERFEIFSYAIETPLTPPRPHYPQVTCGPVHQSSYQYSIQYFDGNDSIPAGNQAVPLSQSIEERRQSRQPGFRTQCRNLLVYAQIYACSDEGVYDIKVVADDLERD